MTGRDKDKGAPLAGERASDQTRDSHNHTAMRVTAKSLRRRRRSFRHHLQLRPFSNDPLGAFVRDNPAWIAQMPDLGSRADLEAYIRVVRSNGLNWLLRDNLRRDFDVLRLLWSEYRRAGR